MSKINYYLRENPLSTSEENRFMANIGKKDTKRQEDVIKHMMGKNTTITEHYILLVMNLMKESVMDLVLDGHMVITDLFKARVGIRGGFRKEISVNASVEKGSCLSKNPSIGVIFDYETRSYGTDFSAGDLIGLKGQALKPDVGDPRIFLRSEDTEELIPVTRINEVTDRSIMCRLPDDLATGSYTIKVVAGDVDEEVNAKYGKRVNIV